MLAAVRACSNGSRRSTASLVEVIQGQHGLTVSTFSGPITLTSLAHVPTTADRFRFVTERVALVRAARRLTPGTSPRLAYGSRFGIISDGSISSRQLPRSPFERPLGSPSVFARPNALLEVRSTPDLSAVHSFIMATPRKARSGYLGKVRGPGTQSRQEPLFLGGTRVELAPGELRFATTECSFHIRHEAFLPPTGDLSYAFTRQVPALLVVSIARAFEAAHGQVAISAFLSEDLYIRYTFATFALTVRVTGDIGDEPEDVDLPGSDDEAE